MKIQTVLVIAILTLITLPNAQAQTIDESFRTKLFEPTSERKFQDSLKNSQLEFYGALELKHNNREVFGGFSCLDISPDGKFITAISDYTSKKEGKEILRSHMIRMEIEYAENGHLSKANITERKQLLGPNNKAVQGCVESLARVKNQWLNPMSDKTGDSFLVSFDDKIDIHKYGDLFSDKPELLNDPGQFEDWESPRCFKRKKDDGKLEQESKKDCGFEAMTAVKDGVMMIAEKIQFEENILNSRAAYFFPFDKGRSPFKLKFHTGSSHFLHPSGATTLSNGNVVVLQRDFDESKKWMNIRLVEISKQKLSYERLKENRILCGKEIFSIKATNALDNLEGIASFNRNGEEFLILISDNNGDKNLKKPAKQITMLVLFKMKQATETVMENSTNDSN